MSFTSQKNGYATREKLFQSYHCTLNKTIKQNKRTAHSHQNKLEKRKI